MRRGLGAPGLLTLPQGLLLSPGSLYEGFEDATDWSLTNGSAADDAVNFKSGAQSVKLTTNAGVQASMIKTVNWTLGAFGQMKLWCYPYDLLADYGGSVMLSLSNDAGFGNFYRAWIPNTGAMALRPGEWNLMSFPRSWFKVGAGAPNWSNPIVRVRLQAQGAAGKTPAVSFDSLFFDIKGVPAVMLHFDDGSSAQYATCFSYMKPRGLKGTLWAQTDLINTGGFVTDAQLREMEAAGWTIGNHTNAATSLAGQAEAAQETQISGGKTALLGWSLPKGVNYVAYPAGGYDANTLVAMAALGMRTGRTVIQNDAISGTPYGVNLIGETPAYLQRSTSGATTTMSEAQAETQVANAIADGAIFAMHHHGVGTGGTNWSEADFQKFCDFLVANGVRTLTQDEYYKLSQGALKVKKR